MNKGRSTQNIVNAFPTWSNTRMDEQSLGFQFINVLGDKLDDLKKQMMKMSVNHYLMTSIVSDIDVYYSVQLQRDYEFTKETDDDTSFIYTPPTISGEVDNVRYSITIAENNDIESFWYTAIPTRLSLEETITGMEYLVASGFAATSPIPILLPSGIIDPVNKLTIEVNGSSSNLFIENNNQLRMGTIKITGQNREGLDVVEEIVFPFDEIQHTYHDFKYLTASGVRVYGIEEADTTTIVVKSKNYNAPDYEVNYTDLDFTEYKDTKATFWGIGWSDTGYKTLDLRKYDTDDIQIRIDGFADRHPFLQQELLNESNTQIDIKDIAVEPFSDRLWVIDSSNLYLFTSNLTYFNMSTLTKKDYQAYSTINPSSYYTIYGNDIELDYLWVRPVSSFLCHRIWVEKPDGNKYSLENGVEITYHTDRTSWIFGEPMQRQIKATDIFTIDQRGNYIFSLEVKYSDDTTTIDQRIVSVLYQTPLAQFSLSTLGITNAKGIDIDSEYKLWILNASGIQYQINIHYDNMLIDFNRKTLYFRDLYDKIIMLED